MGYQTLEFVGFVLLVLLAYYLVKKPYRKVVLTAANLVFYCIAGAKYLPFLLATMVATFFSAKKMGAIYRESDAKLAGLTDPASKKAERTDAKKRAKRALAGGMFVAIALLAVCKYLGFLMENVNALLGAMRLGEIPMFRMILPVGISFYTFMALSYVLDVYWKRYPAETDFLTYAAFLSYFPHVVQGPIDRFNEFKQQLHEAKDFSYENLTSGAQLMLWGFIKKLVVADRLAVIVDQVFDHVGQHNSLLMVLTIAAYSIQIYADFSGCIDIVSGVSEMLGIRLRKNFNHPYFSRTMAEFWRRWHISLQEWFKDYVYFPVSASELVKKVKKSCKAKDRKRLSELFAACFPILVVWMITGIWHGADWKFVAWGVFHAFLLISGKVFENTFITVNRKLHINTEGWLWKLWQMLRTFVLCCIGRVFFRANTLSDAFVMIRRILNPACLRQFYDIDGVSIELVITWFIGFVILLVVDILQERMSIRKTLAKKNIVLRWALLYGALFVLLFFGSYGAGGNAGSFIYEQF